MDSQPFPLFRHFPELKVAIVDKTDDCTSNERAAKLAGFSDVAFTEQTHGNTIHIADGPLHGEVKADGIITTTKNLALIVRWADCQNFVVYAPSRRSSEQTGVLGILHAGWRGLARNAITALFDALKQRFNVAPEETFVGAGPSLCKKCAMYPDGRRLFPPHMHPFIDGDCTVPRTVPRSGSGARVDLIACAESQLDDAGVPRSHRERHPDLTCCMREKYWTNRGGDSGEVQAGTGRNYLVAGIIE
jgi:copper oxidase (laccase) domain-containing protein